MLRLTVLALLLLSAPTIALAQRPGPQFRRRVSCEPYEPRTRLELLDEKYATVLLKGFTRITTLDIRDLRVDALEIRDLGSTTRASGIVFALRESGERTREERAFIDYEEIDALISAIDAVSRVNESMTKLVGFEARYRTPGDLEIGVFRQTRSGTAVTVSAGLCERISVSLTLDELAKMRAMIVEAKSKLDEIK